MGCPRRFLLAIPLAKLLHHRVDVLIENSCCLCLAQCAYQLIVNALFSPSWPALWPDWWRAWLWLNHLASRYQVVLNQHLRLSHPVVQVHWAQMPEFASFRMTRWPAAVAHYGMVSIAVYMITPAASIAAATHHQKSISICHPLSDKLQYQRAVESALYWLPNA